MARQDNIAQIEHGRQATAIGAAIQVYVDDRMRSLVTDLMAIYRNGAMGPISHDMLIGKVAEITAMADMMSDLDNAGLRGDIAANREFGNAKEG
jgi:hypothetical protein